MTKLPVEPYWVNAANWWLKNHNDNNHEFNLWLREQGVHVVKRDKFYPWIEFHEPVHAVIFQLKWSD